MHEDIERVRQQVMRFRELLDILRVKLEEGERTYAALLAEIPTEMKEKDRQWQAAETLVNDVAPLERAVMQVGFDVREMHRAFEELHGIIIA